MTAKTRRDQIKALEDSLKIAEDNLCKNSSDVNRKTWDEAKTNLESEYEYITQGIIIRSRAEGRER